MRFNEASNSLRYQCVTAERRKDSDLLWLQNLRLCSRFTQIHNIHSLPVKLQGTVGPVTASEPLSTKLP